MEDKITDKEKGKDNMKTKDTIRMANADQNKDEIKSVTGKERKQIPYDAKTDTRNMQNTVSAR